MARQRRSTRDKEIADAVPADVPAEVPAEVPADTTEYSVGKYLELFQPDMHVYTKSYVAACFRGKMGTKSDWEIEINALTEAKT